MASTSQIRQYLAHWFQLGKQVVVEPMGTPYCPKPVNTGNHYSPEFEACWAALVAAGLEHCYMENTTRSLAELATPTWDITACYRCSMPIAQSVGGMSPVDCPCSDQSNWPNLELPSPQSPQDWTKRIQSLGDRLR